VELLLESPLPGDVYAADLTMTEVDWSDGGRVVVKEVLPLVKDLENRSRLDASLVKKGGELV